MILALAVIVACRRSGWGTVCLSWCTSNPRDVGSGCCRGQYRRRRPCSWGWGGVHRCLDWSAVAREGTVRRGVVGSCCCSWRRGVVGRCCRGWRHRRRLNSWWSNWHSGGLVNARWHGLRILHAISRGGVARSRPLVVIDAILLGASPWVGGLHLFKETHSARCSLLAVIGAVVVCAIVFLLVASEQEQEQEAGWRHTLITYFYWKTGNCNGDRVGGCRCVVSGGYRRVVIRIDSPGLLLGLQTDIFLVFCQKFRYI